MLYSFCFPKCFKTLVFPHIFVYVAIILYPWFFSKTFQEPGGFPGFCGCYFHVVSILFSKTCQEPGIFPGFCACCFHIVPILFTNTFQKAGVLQGFYGCCFHVVSILISKMFQEPGIFPGFCEYCFHVVSILPPFYVHIVFQNISRIWYFRRFVGIWFHVIAILLSKMFQEPGIFLVSPGFCVCCFYVVFMLLSEAIQEPGVFPGFVYIAFRLYP